MQKHNGLDPFLATARLLQLARKRNGRDSLPDPKKEVAL